MLIYLGSGHMLIYVASDVAHELLRRLLSAAQVLVIYLVYSERVCLLCERVSPVSSGDTLSLEPTGVRECLL